MEEREVEKIRENHSRETYVRGRTSGRKFASTFLVSFVVVLVVLFTVVSASQAASLIGGAGGVKIEIGELVGQDASIYPAAGQSATCYSTISTLDGRPEPNDRALVMLKADVRDANIPAGEKIRLEKGIKMPDIMPELDNITIVLSQFGNPGQTTVDNTTFLVTQLNADLVDFQQTIIKEAYSDPASSNTAYSVLGPGPKTFETNTSKMGEMYLNGDQARLVNASGVLHFLSFSSLKMDNLRLEVLYNEPDAPVPNGTCPLDNPQIVPTNEIVVDTVNDWNQGTYWRTSAERKDMNNLGHLGLGYVNGSTLGASNTQPGSSYVVHHRWDIYQDGNWTDYADGNNEGRLIGSSTGLAQNEPGVMSTDAPKFDGETNAVWPDGYALPDGCACTLSYWVNYASTSGNQRSGVWDNGNGGRFYVGLSSGNLIAGVGDTFDSIAFPKTLETGRWYHYVLTTDGSTARVYLDGEQVNSFSHGYGSSLQEPIFGATWNDANGVLEWYIDGRVDEGQIWERSLSTNEVENLYFKGQDGTFNGEYLTQTFDVGSVVEWQFIEIDATVPENTSANATVELIDGGVVDQKKIPLSTGINRADLRDMQNTQQIRVRIQGTSTKPGVTWEIYDMSIEYPA